MIKYLTLIALLLLPAISYADTTEKERVGGQLEGEIDGKRVIFPNLKTDIKVEVNDDLATVHITQTFENPFKQPLNANYLFPLQQDAAVNHMVMEVGDERIIAKIKRIEEARQTFEDARAEGKAAALLTQYRPNMFTQDVANVMPGKSIKVTLTYVQTLPKTNNGYEVVLPLIVGPRYQPEGSGVSPISDQKTKSKETIQNWELNELPPDPDVAGLTLPDTIESDRVAIEINLNSSLPINNIGSNTHNITEDKVSDTKRIIRLAQGRVVDNKDFVLHFNLGGTLPQAGMLAHNDNRGGFFSLLLEPPAIPAAKDIAAREMVFVMDTSGSMDGEPIDASKIFMQHALNGLRPQDYFRIVRFSNNAEEFSSEPVSATPENIRKGQNYVNSLTADGGTEVNAAIEQAFHAPPKKNILRVVVFLTDGYIGNESEVLQLLDQKIGDARLYAFGVGTSVNRYLLEEMSLRGRGFARFIDPTEDASDAAIQLAGKLESPVLTDIKVDWGDLKPKDIVPSRIPDLFAGSSLRIQGRYDKPGKHTVIVEGLINGRKAKLPVTIDLPTKANDNNEVIPAIWARTQVADWMRQIDMPTGMQAASNSDDLKNKVTDLGLQFNLVTRWTSFVAVSEKIVNAHPENNANTNVPLPMVEGVTEKAYGTASNIASGAVSMAMNSFSGGAAPEPATMGGLITLGSLAVLKLRRRRRGL